MDTLFPPAVSPLPPTHCMNPHWASLESPSPADLMRFQYQLGSGMLSVTGKNTLLGFLVLLKLSLLISTHLPVPVLSQHCCLCTVILLWDHFILINLIISLLSVFKCFITKVPAGWTNAFCLKQAAKNVFANTSVDVMCSDSVWSKVYKSVLVRWA